MESEDSSGAVDIVTQCPLCQTPVGSRDELQLHYLTSCSGYDKVSNEQPRSKLSTRGSYGDVGGGGGAALSEGGGALGGEDSDMLSDTTTTSGRGAVGWASGSTETNLSTATSTSVPRNDCSVQFMWQPSTHITYSSVNLLASFRRGSVELNPDPEGGHYASEFVNIERGTYEGQLVVGDNFIHPVQDFSVTKDDDIIVLHFKISSDYLTRNYTGYDMTTNPSYGSTTPSTGYTKSYIPSSVSFSNPMFNNYGGVGGEGDTTYNSHYGYKNRSHQAGAAAAGIGEGHSHYSDTGAMSTSRKYAHRDHLEASSSIDIPTSTTPSTETSSENLPTSMSGIGQYNYKLLETHASSNRQSEAVLRTGLSYGTSSAQENVLNTRERRESPPAPSSSPEQQEGGVVRQGEVEDLVRRLEEMTHERDMLRAGQSNQERVQAMHQSRIKRLEQQLEGKGIEPSGEEDNLRREINELKDRNTALEVQIREYSETVLDQHKAMQGNLEARQLLDLTKRQQMEQVESFSRMKAETEKAMKVYDECIKLSQINITLTGEMHDYKERFKLFMTEMQHKDEEIEQLKSSLADKNTDRLALELESMREKCDGWREEVERLMPLEDDVRKLRKENEELAQQMTMMVEEVEKKKEDTLAGGEAGGGGNVMDYDTLMKRMEELQDTRVAMEEELRSLRAERASILQENASLHEGSQPQMYFNLKSQYENIMKHLREKELQLNEEQKQRAELHTANLELHQKLKTAIDPDMLKSVQDRIVRYRNERDQAKAELEGKHAELLAAEKSAQDALASRGTDTEKYKLMLDTRGEELVRLKREVVRMEAKMLRYREERNREREQVKLLRQQIKMTQELHQELPVTTSGLEGADLETRVERETSRSPSHDLQYAGSPTLEYANNNYTNELAHLQHQHQRDCDTPEEGTTSPSYKYHSKMAMPDTYATKPKVESSSSMYHTADVTTKDGVVQMDIQKPSVQLSPKQKPQVIVRREGGVYEAGTLLFVGKVNGKELAGVHMDVRIQKPTTANACDGTYAKDGKRYFKCPNGHGAYVPLSRIYIEMESATV